MVYTHMTNEEAKEVSRILKEMCKAPWALQYSGYLNLGANTIDRLLERIKDYEQTVRVVEKET